MPRESRRLGGCIQVENDGPDGQLGHHGRGRRRPRVGSMAGDWIPMREDLHEDPAVLEIAHRLNTRPEHVTGYCLRFWAWASRNLVLDLSPENGDSCPDAVLHGVPISSIESVLNLPGFLSHLCSVGWLRYEDNGPSGPVLTIPKFDRWLSQGAKTRVVATQKKRRQRAIEAAKSVPDVSRKCPPKKGTREEKRREYKEEAPNGACAEPPQTADAAPPSKWSFDIQGKGEKTWNLPADKLAEYAESYPGLDIESEFRRARQWLRDNPAKRKTATGMLAFLTRWLNKEINQGRGRGGDARGSQSAAERYLASENP